MRSYLRSPMKRRRLVASPTAVSAVTTSSPMFCPQSPSSPPPLKLHRNNQNAPISQRCRMLLPAACASVYQPSMECALVQGANATATFIRSFANDLFAVPVSMSTECMPATALAYATRFKTQLRVLLDLPLDGKEPPVTKDAVVSLLHHESIRYRNLLALDLLTRTLVELHQSETNPKRQLAEFAAVATLQDNGAFGCLTMSDLPVLNQLCCKMPPERTDDSPSTPSTFDDYANLFHTTSRANLVHWDIQYQKLRALLTGFGQSTVQYVAVGDCSIARSALRIAFRMRQSIVNRLEPIRLNEHVATPHQLALQTVTSFIRRHLWKMVLDALLPVLSLIQLEYADMGFKAAVDQAFEDHICQVKPSKRIRSDRLLASGLPHVSLDPLTDFTVPGYSTGLIELSDSNDDDDDDDDNDDDGPDNWNESNGPDSSNEASTGANDSNGSNNLNESTDANESTETVGSTSWTTPDGTITPNSNDNNEAESNNSEAESSNNEAESSNNEAESNNREVGSNNNEAESNNNSNESSVIQ